MTQDRVTNSSITANGGIVLLTTEGMASGGIQLSGTFTGTLQFEATIDGTNWSSLTGSVVGSTSTATSATAAGVWTASVAGLLAIRVRASAWTSGTANVALRAALAGGGTGSSSGGGGGGGGDASAANQDTMIASLSVIDDWDESDRAKVNIIAGQTGITAGAGAVSTNTPRVTHASDDPVTTALQIMDDWDESDRAKVNPIVGQAGLQGGSGTVSASTQRVVLATDVALPAGNNNIGDVDVASSALPTGASTLAEQQTQTASLSVLDDWDETDRAKVNIIAGQAGVAANSGTSSASTQRVVLATDTTVPNVTGNIASGATDSGNPVKTGGKFNTTAPTLTDGQRGDTQLDVNGNTKTTLGTALQGEDFVNNAITVRQRSGWSQAHSPAANTQATTSKSAGASGVRHVANAIIVTASAGASAPTAVQLTWNLRDGATGAGTVLASGVMAIPAVAGQAAPPVMLSGLWIEGTAATAMTLEFTAAGGANTIESVTLVGQDIT